MTILDVDAAGNDCVWRDDASVTNRSGWSVHQGENTPKLVAVVVVVADDDLGQWRMMLGLGNVQSEKNYELPPEQLGNWAEHGFDAVVEKKHWMGVQRQLYSATLGDIIITAGKH